MPFVLPKKHRYAHRYSIFLHDLMVGMFKAAEDAAIFSVRLDSSPEEVEALRDLEGEALYDWVERNKPDVCMLMDYKSIIAGVTSDFCHFMLEALNASAKGKLAVAYALFRKPLRDNLFVLEWLLADPEDFLRRFADGSPDTIAIQNLPVERRKEIISAAIREAESTGADADFFYEVRYEKTAPWGLSVTWDRAVHLLTTWNHTRTEPQNLSFVFSGPEQWESQWTGIYSNVPFMLYHASKVFEKLVATIAEVDADYLVVKDLRRNVGFMYWGRHLQGVPEEAEELVTSIIPDLDCPNCGRNVRWHRNNMRSLVLRGSVRCYPCRALIHLDTTDDHTGS